MPPRQELAPRPSQDTSHMLPEGHRSSIGPLVGAVIVIVLLAFGALYFYGEYLNSQNNPQEVPLIQGDISA